MKKLNFLYISIIFILVFNNYIDRIFGKILDRNILNILETINILLLLVFTSIIFIIKKKISYNYMKKMLSLLFFSIFLKKYYLSFFIIIISNLLNKKQRLKYLLFILSFFYILVLILNGLGFLEFNALKSAVRKFQNFQVYRNTLGFNHPNAAMSLLLPIFSIIYYLYYDKYKKSVLIIILAIGKIIFDFTHSRTTFILIILLIILILIKDKYIKKMKFLFLMSGNIIVFLTFYLPIYFKNSILNKLFSGRLRLFYYYLENYKITFLGDKKVISDYREYILDNTYLRILFENGLLGLMLTMLLIYYAMNILFKNKDYKAVRIFFIILIFGFMESSAFFYYFNVIYFIIGDYFLKENIKNIKMNFRKGGI